MSSSPFTPDGRPAGDPATPTRHQAATVPASIPEPPSATTTPAPTAETSAIAGSPGTGSGWIGYAAAIWAAVYGVVALIWTITGSGFPFGRNDPQGRAGPLRDLPPEVGAPLFAVVLLATAVACLAMAGSHAVRPSRAGRALLLGFGWTVAAALLILVPTVNVLALTGYAPMLILGAPFGWPRGIDYGTVFTWSLGNQVWCMLGGFLAACTVLSWQRRSRGACARCGRGRDFSGADRLRIAAWGRRATIVAVVIPLLYSVSRYAWLAGVPLGISDEMLRDLWDSGAVWAGAGLGTFAVAGAILTLGLIQRWGEVFPRWMIGLAGRRVPIRLAVIPAAYVVPIVISGGLGMTFSPESGHLTGYSPVLVATHALWPLWGVALAVATYGYQVRRRGACDTCGRQG
ncbi:hypothetical protein ABZ260_30855 [Streptosporangium sp. NPDC006013]|uniref:hypothetical protein n=1 Tax=Streptosporangium sp. NPDC006013 TaxID=3155596 RepID=UPI0033B113E0